MADLMCRIGLHAWTKWTQEVEMQVLFDPPWERVVQRRTCQRCYRRKMRRLG